MWMNFDVYNDRGFEKDEEWFWQTGEGDFWERERFQVQSSTTMAPMEGGNKNVLELHKKNV